MPLAHDLTKIVPGKFKGRAFTRGHVIREEDIPELLKIGKEHIYVLDLPEGYLHEEEAARRMADAIAGNGIMKSKPKEGKIVLKAAHPGLVKIDPETVNRMNDLEGIAVSTIYSDEPVEQDQTIAGVRPIPLIIEEKTIQALEQFADEARPVISVKPFISHHVGIVTTGSEVFKGRIKDRFGPVLKEKIEKYGSTLLEQVFADDDMNMIGEKIKQMIEKGADLVLVTGGMSVDPDDRTPGAIQRIATDVVKYGTPVLPGSMLMVAYHQDIPIVGLPGGAIHDPYTAFDILLPRILAGEKIKREEITRLGYGGFRAR
ncbi:MAG: molybdopterin-binding protein [Bacillaceae bacterium]|nr:molybdopterin-binding protein [Bacillaceae bacterium]